MTACTVSPSGSINDIGGKQFEVMLNPSSYRHHRKICYSKRHEFGQIASASKFDGIQPDTVSFNIVVDGTGVTKTPIPGLGSKDVTTQMETLNKVVYAYDGESHEPNHVKLAWGVMIFYGRLLTMSVDYTLFKLNGEPLRAKVDLEFQGFMPKSEQDRRKNQSSPDLTHLVEFRQGDSLPLLCYRIYEDSSYYLEVARVNEISAISDIAPGTRLVFPPLSQGR